MSYDIQKDIPMPGRRSGGKASKYPFADMEEGDSFVIPAEEGRRISAVRAAIDNWRKRHDMRIRFRARQLEDGAIGVWRIS